MSEHMSPIPSRLYNAAVGGHVAGADQIIDDALGLEQSSINEDVAPMPYNDGNPNGMGRIILKKTDNFKNIVEAQSGNTIFIIKYDFTLTDNVVFPTKSILKFEGGHIILGNYTISGGIINSYLNVSDFTLTDDIAKPLNVILPITNAYVPKGIWVIREDVILQRKIFGVSDRLSEIRINGSATFRIRSWHTIVHNIAFTCCGTNYAITISGATRFLDINNISIQSLYGDNTLNLETLDQGSGILVEFEEPAPDTTYYLTLSKIRNVYINNVQKGITFNLQRRTDCFVTDLTLDNVLVDTFFDYGIAIFATRMYNCRFNNITIRDAYKGTVDHKGIVFGYDDGQGHTAPCGNTLFFNNLITWADAKKGTHEFYALYFANYTAADEGQGYNYITGSIEGKIGGVGNWSDITPHFRYNIMVSLVTSINVSPEPTNQFVGSISNYDVTVLHNVFNIFDYLYANYVSEIDSTNYTSTIYGKNIKVQALNNEARTPWIKFYLGTKLPDNFIIIIQAKAHGGELSTIDTRILDGGNTAKYFGNISSCAFRTDDPLETDNENSIYVSDIASNVSGSSFRLQLKANNAEILYVRSVWVIGIPSANYPTWIFKGNSQFASLIRKISYLPNGL